MGWSKSIVVAILGLGAAILTVADTARAEDEFDVSVSGNTVTVTAKGSWHVNAKYPWKYTAGSTSLDSSAFSFADMSAKLANAPKGAGKIKGGVCAADGGSCKSFSKDVTVQ